MTNRPHLVKIKQARSLPGYRLALPASADEAIQLDAAKPADLASLFAIRTETVSRTLRLRVSEACKLPEEELGMQTAVEKKEYRDNRFIKDLEQLKMTILEMAALSEKAAEKAVQAFFDRDVELAEQVIRGDHQINLLEVEVDRQSLRLLALGQPMARDLRFIIGCMRTAVDLERIADLAAGVARRAVFLSRRPPLPHSPLLEQLADTALDMLRTVIDAFIKQSVDRARDVCQLDDTADELNVAVLKSLLDYMVKELPAAESSVQTIITARYLERLADQATNIAESVVFIAQGLNIKHRADG